MSFRLSVRVRINLYPKKNHSSNSHDELPRTSLLGIWVNKGKKKGREGGKSGPVMERSSGGFIRRGIIARG
jgi:hypothetical protein